MAVTINGTTGILAPDIGIDGTTLTVDAVNNRVGIGTTTPFGTLQVRPGTNANFSFSTGAGESSLEILNDAGSANVPLNVRASEYKIKIQGTEKLSIDSGGRIGIGGNGIGSGLGVYLQRSSPNTTNFYEASDGTKKMIAGVDSTNDYVKIGSLSSHRVGLVAGNGEKISILPSGNIGIGILSPRTKLDLADGQLSFSHRTDYSIRFYNGAGNNWSSIHNPRVNDGTNSSELAFKVAQGEALRIATDKKIGINVTNPDLTLHVNGTNALPSSSGSTATGHLTLRNKAGNSSHGMFMGVSGAAPWGSWIQAQDASNNATNYPLLLNPNGGNVGIGINNPANILHIKNDSPTIRLESSASSYIGRNTIGQYQAGLYIECDNDNAISNSFTTFSVDGSEKLRIDSSGRTCISSTSHFGSASTNMLLSIVNNGGSGGYPAIHLGSVSTGGNTNSASGMSIVATDANWNLQTNSGGVHGLGILTGNSSNSGNAAMYIRSDKKIILGPQTYSYLSTATSCNAALHVAGGGISIGSVGNSNLGNGDPGEGGRNVLGWYMYGYTSNTNAYAHIITSLHGGAGSNTHYIMGGFRIHGFRYHSAGVSEERIYFHNWGGSLANYTRNHWGSWDPGNIVYVNSSGYVTLRLYNANYYGYDIDLIQYPWYPVREIKVTSVSYSNSTTI